MRSGIGNVDSAYAAATWLNLRSRVPMLLLCWDSGLLLLKHRLAIGAIVVFHRLLLLDVMSDPWNRAHDYSAPRGRYHPEHHVPHADYPEHGRRGRRPRGFGMSRSSSSSSSPESHREAVSRREPEIDEKPAGRTLPSGATVKVYSKANSEYNLTVRNKEVVLAPAHTADDRQLWIRDSSWSNRVRDDAGHPAFALINKDTGLALQHAPSEGQQVRLVHYDPKERDESVLWTLSDEIQDGYKAIRLAINTKLNLDAWQATPQNGGVHDGTVVCIYKWNKQSNQQWKIVPV